MGVRVDVGVILEDLSVRTDEIGDALGKGQEGARGPHRFGELVVAIAEKPEWESVLLGEGPILLRRVVGDAEDLDSEILQLVPAVPQLVCLQRSTGGVGFGVEEEQKWPALEVPARYR